MKTKNNINWEVETVIYSVRLVEDDMDLIIKNDELQIKKLKGLLNSKFNIYDSDYNSYSNKIWFTIGNKDNTIALRERVINFIDNHITTIKKTKG